MAAHTPVPWLRDGLLVYALHRFDGRDVNRFSANVDAWISQGGTQQEAEANANLIAAAPDLLTELIALTVYHAGYPHDDDCPQDDTCECSAKPKNDRLNAVIAKAEGR